MELNKDLLSEVIGLEVINLGFVDSELKTLGIQFANKTSNRYQAKTGQVNFNIHELAKKYKNWLLKEHNLIFSCIPKWLSVLRFEVVLYGTTGVPDIYDMIRIKEDTNKNILDVYDHEPCVIFEVCEKVFNSEYGCEDVR